MIPGQILLNARPYSRVFQALEQFLDTAIGDPGRKGRGQRRSAGSIGIHVRGNVEAGIAGELDGGHDVFHAAPARLAANFQVKDFDGQIGFVADTNGLGERGHFRSAFAAHVGGIKAAVF